MAKMTLQTKINARQILTTEIEQPKIETCLLGLNALMAYDGKCGECGSEDVTLQVKRAKGYTFTEFKCLACGSRAQWGQYKDGGFFLKSWEMYAPENNKYEAKEETKEEFEDDFPF